MSVPAASIWTNATIQYTSYPDTDSYELGVKFKSAVPGYITGIRFYKGLNNTGSHAGTLWASDGTPLQSIAFSGETPEGWQQQLFITPVPITAGTTYVASYSCLNGGYAVNIGSFAGATNYPLRALPDGEEGGNGVFNADPGSFPALGGGNNYWVDVVFSETLPVDTNAPTVISVSPVPGASEVQPGASVKVVFSEHLLPSSVDTNTFTLVNASSNLVPATVSYTPGSTEVTLQPLSPLTLGQTYGARVKGGANGIKDPATNALVSDFTWSFTIAASPSVSLFDPGTVPPQAVDNSALTLGVKFQSAADGFIRGIRFYKWPDNTGPHTGILWTADGTKLAEAGFVGESVSGWQEQLFTTPVAIASNTTYIASYVAPNGNYAFTGGYFLDKGVTNSPLIALPDALAGGNGVFVESTTAFPTNSFNGANYWVDVVYVATLGSDTNAPVVIANAPANGATGVSLTPQVTATFNEPMLPSSINTNSFELRNAGNVLVPATVGYDSGSRTATLLPVGTLGINQTYTARVKGGVTNGVKDAATNALALDFVWNFTTTASAGTNIFGPGTPTGTLSVSDTAPVELGVKFRSAMAGYVRGIRFYKGVNNTGSHIGTLWSANGTPLATVAFTNETATGWQQQLFPAPVAIASNTTYIASYFAPNGGYAFESLFFDGKSVTNFPLRALQNLEDGGNGVYNDSGVNAFPSSSFNAANYWVDIVFTDQNSPPTAGTLNRTLPEDTSTNLTLIGSDADGAITFALLSSPAHGTLSNFNTNTGAITYTPFTNYFGPDTFTYRVSDGTLFATGTVNLTITGVNDPALADNKSIFVAKDTVTNLVLTATDPDGASSVSEVLVATATATPNNWNTNGTASKVVAVAANDGAATFINSSGTANTQQQFVLSDPVFMQPGDPIISVILRSVARRGGNGSSSYRTALFLSGGGTANSSSHSASSTFGEFTDAFVTRPGGGAWTLADVQNVQMRLENLSRDIDCTKFDALVSFQGNTNRSYTILSGPSHGSLTGLNTNNGTIAYTPAAGYVGLDSFTFRVNAGGLLSTGLVSISVVGTNNGPVVANPIGTQAAGYGTNFSFTFPANTFTDLDTPLLSYSATGMPPGILFTNSTRTFAGTPTASGDYSVRLVATDNSVPALSATNNFTIAVAKAALTVTARSTNKPYGVPFSFAGNEFTTAGLKPGDSVSAATLGSTGAPAGAAAGNYPVTISNATGSASLTNYTVAYVNGTLTVDPPLPYSITSIGVTNDVATITWQSISGRVYRLEYKDLLTSPTWIEIPADIVATGATATATNVTGGATNRFYRVK